MAYLFTESDPEYLEITHLEDIKAVSSKRASRKGVLTRTEKYLQLQRELPLDKVDLKDLQRKLQETSRGVALFELLQSKWDDLAAASELEVTDVEVDSLERARSAHDSLIRSFEDLINRVKINDDYVRFSNKLDALEACTTVVPSTIKSADKLAEQIDNWSADVTRSHDPSLIALLAPLVGRVETLNVHLNSLLEVTSSPRSDTSDSSTHSVTAVFKPSRAPKLDLPTFHGQILEWPSFNKLFQSFLAENKDLTSSQRCKYLLNCMKGEDCRKVVVEAAGEDLNFDSAYRALLDRYAQNRASFNKHFSALISNQPITYSHRDISNAVLEMKTTLRGLTVAGATTIGHLAAAFLEKRMDERVKARWSERSGKMKDPPTFDVVCEFLEELLPGMAAEEEPFRPKSFTKDKGKHKHQKSPKTKQQSKSAVVMNTQESSTSCMVCKSNDHIFLFKCAKFRNMTSQQKLETVRKLQLCFNCLNTNHMTKDCYSAKSCKTCNQKHHTVLHDSLASSTNTSGTAEATQQTAASITTPSIEPAQTVNQHLENPSTTKPIVPLQMDDCSEDLSSSPDEEESDLSDNDTEMVANIKAGQPSSLLSTALVSATSKGRTQVYRALLDPGATISLITLRAAKQLGCRLDTNRLDLSVVGGGHTCQHSVSVALTPSPAIASFNIKQEEESTIHTTCFVMSTLTTVPPCSDLAKVRQLDLIRNCNQLADPDFGEGLPVDFLLGMRDITLADRWERRFSPDKRICLTKTVFGWTVSGFAPESTNHVCYKVSVSDQLLSRLWEQEEPPKEVARLDYIDSHTRLPDGRYQVQLPRLNPQPELGNSLKAATKRYVANERSLKRKGTLQAFEQVLQEYQDLQHCELVPPSDLNKPDKEVFYLPMHGVCKESSTTTKLRVVFDGSAVTTSGFSLNQVLLPTPSLLPLLTSMINKFRTHRIGMTADVSKMYREVSLAPIDRDLHRFLRRSSTTGELVHWRMTRLTFGVAASPYLAMQIIHQIARDEGHHFPQAAKILTTSFYVDDCLTGAESVDQAVKLQKDLCSLLLKGKMILRKWRSNSPAVTDQIPDHLLEKEQSSIEPSSHSSALKTLGIHWNVKRDVFRVAFPDFQPTSQATKRIIASSVARLFDAMGWYTPVVLQMKLLLQQIWKLHLDWDTPVPQPLHDIWETWMNELPTLSKHHLPRRLTTNESPIKSCELHGFADASEKAYGCVVYSRCFHADGQVVTAIVTGKSKVAPLKVLSIPRLELNAALLLARTLKIVAIDLASLHPTLHCWLDSQITLGWLSKPSYQWKTYVGNRVAEVATLLPDAQWHYISTKSNPADIASRSTSPAQLLHSSLWWHGPSWLSTQKQPWLTDPEAQLDTSVELPEEKPAICSVSASVDLWLFYQRHSSYIKLLRSFAWLLRSIKLFKRQPVDLGPLRPDELEQSRIRLTIISQSNSFHTAVANLKQQTALPFRSPLARLNPYLDHNGLLRVGGRLAKSHIDHDTQHPVILLASDHFTRLFIHHTHVIFDHPGPSTMMSILSSSHYIIRLRDTVKAVTRQCISCRKSYARTATQLMGDLPPSRTSPSPPFQAVGVDLCGPFITIRGYSRKPVHLKTYVVVFICMSTRAIHLEVCEDLSTQTFIGALRRFIARRGLPRDVYSDNGSNFIGTQSELQLVKDFHRSSDYINSTTNFAASHNVRWHTIPPRTPHMGGLWEAGVRIMKLQLRKILTNKPLSYSQLETIIIQVEAVLNNRPLLPVSQDSANDDLPVLTPAHFLIGRPLYSLPVSPDCQVKLWKTVNTLFQSFWTSWHKCYIQSLQSRTKWQKRQPNFKIGDIVLVKDSTLSSSDHWPVGRIISTHPGSDGCVRVVTIKIGSKTYQRGINRVVYLLSHEDSPLHRGEDVGDHASCSREEN